MLDQRGLAGAVRADDGDPLRALHDDGPAAVLQLGQPAAARDVGVRQGQMNVLLLAHPGVGGVHGGLRGLHLVVERGAHRAGGRLCLARAVAREDLRDAAVALGLLGGPLAPGELGLRLDPLPLLDLQGLLRGARGLHGGRLLALAVLQPRAVRAAEPLQRSPVQLGGAIHVLQELEVVTDDDERAGPLVDELGELRAGGTVEVVRRLVEQGDRGAADAQAGDGDEHRLAAGELRDATVKVGGGEAHLVQGLVGAGLDVPVVADRVEVPLVDVAGLDRGHRGEDAVDAEQLGDRGVPPQGQGLGKVADVARCVDAAGGRGELAGDQAEQGGLARTVAADQAGAAGAEGAADAVEGDRAVRPLEGEVVQGDRGCAGHAGIAFSPGRASAHGSGDVRGGFEPCGARAALRRVALSTPPGGHAGRVHDEATGAPVARLCRPRSIP